MSSINQLLKEQTMVPTVRCDTTVAHNYSIQTLNSTELANQALRHVLKEARIFVRAVFFMRV